MGKYHQNTRETPYQRIWAVCAHPIDFEGDALGFHQQRLSGILWHSTEACDTDETHALGATQLKDGCWLIRCTDVVMPPFAFLDYR